MNTTVTLSEVQKALRKKSNPQRAKVSMSFFKTAPGEYSHGDQFIGVRVPDIRLVATLAKDLSLNDVTKLLRSKIHEERLLATIILVKKSTKADLETRQKIYDLYLKNLEYINNWDIVDGSAEHIIGRHLFEADRSLLFRLVRSKNLWFRRIAILSTFHFIRKNDFKDTFAIAEILLSDEHDLIHKAVGWLLREVGKRDLAAEEKFLKKHYKKMPRTMLRYAIEKFPEKKRKAYLNSTIA